MTDVANQEPASRNAMFKKLSDGIHYLDASIRVIIREIAIGDIDALRERARSVTGRDGGLSLHAIAWPEASPWEDMEPLLAAYAIESDKIDAIRAKLDSILPVECFERALKEWAESGHRTVDASLDHIIAEKRSARGHMTNAQESPTLDFTCHYCGASNGEVEPIHRFMTLVNGEHVQTCLDCTVMDERGVRLGVKQKAAEVASREVSA